MNIKVLAIEPIEGKAFFEEDGRIFHIRPLYGEEMIFPSSEIELNLVLQRESYLKCEEKFPNIKSAIEFLRNRYVDERSETGLKILGDDILKEIIINSDDKLLLNYVQKAINVWIPEGNILNAKQLLNDLSEMPNLKSKEELSKSFTNLKILIENFESSVPIRIVEDDFAKEEINSTVLVEKFPSFLNANKEVKSILFYLLNRRQTSYMGFCSYSMGCRA